MLPIRIITSGKKQKLRPTPQEVIPSDPLLGDHYYTSGQYTDMFDAHGFVAREVKSFKPSHKLFILVIKQNEST